MPFTLQGADALHARMDAIRGVFRPTGARWQNDASLRMRAKARTSQRIRQTIRPGRLSDSRAEVKGDFRLIFIDKGTKPHRIEPKRFSGSKRGGPGRTSTLAFPYHGQTVYARRVKHPGSRKHPFIAKAARDALRADPMAEELVRLWNSTGGRVTTKGVTQRRGSIARLP